jgi:geranylgeranyl diphosphate synthase type I
MTVAARRRSASQVLAWSRTVFAPALQEAVESLPGPMRRIAGYHLGWWDSDGTPAEADGGKSIRPALALLSAEAAGGAAQDAIPVAVAVELVHNFSLLHDDVIDRDDTRRHRLTAWRVFGLGSAILAGNALLTLAFEVLTANRLARTGIGEAGREDPARILCATVQALIDGQYADLAFESRADVDLTECIQMAEGKTASLISCACALGAVAGRATPAQVDHLYHFGAAIGLAFQLVDDMQGIWGDPMVTGKPVYSDLRNRKKSLPVVAALTSGTAAAGELAAWYRTEAVASDAELVRGAELVDQAGGRRWSQARLNEMEAEAMDHLRAAAPDSRALDDLAVLASLVVSR